MDHQVHDNADVQASPWKTARSSGLNVLGLFKDGIRDTQRQIPIGLESCAGQQRLGPPLGAAQNWLAVA